MKVKIPAQSYVQCDKCGIASCNVPEDFEMKATITVQFYILEGEDEGNTLEDTVDYCDKCFLSIKPHLPGTV